MLGNKEDKLGQAEGDGFRIGRGCGLSSGTSGIPGGMEADIDAHQCHCLWQGAVTCLQGFVEVAIVVYDLCGSLIPLLTRWALWEKTTNRKSCGLGWDLEGTLEKTELVTCSSLTINSWLRLNCTLEYIVMFEFCPYFIGGEPFLTSLSVHVKDMKYG